MGDAQLGEIGADEVHHRSDRARAKQPQPFALGRGGVFVSEFLGQRFADRDQVVAGIKTLGNLADILAKRLAVTDMRRPGEDIDLPAGIVDVVFARNPVPGRGEQAGKRIAHHRAATMAHVHRPGRVGGDILDIDPSALAHRGLAVTIAQRRNRAHFVDPGAPDYAKVDEARTGNLGALDIGIAIEVRDDLLRQRARIGLRRLGEHHGRISGDIAMRGIARRLDRDVGAVRIGR